RVDQVRCPHQRQQREERGGGGRGNPSLTRIRSAGDENHSAPARAHEVGEALLGRGDPSSDWTTDDDRRFAIEQLIDEVLEAPAQPHLAPSLAAKPYRQFFIAPDERRRGLD